jgi:hypothetical protein
VSVRVIRRRQFAVVDVVDLAFGRIEVARQRR